MMILLKQIDEKSAEYFNSDEDKGVCVGDRCVVQCSCI